MHACVSRLSAAPSFAVYPLMNSLECQSTSGGHRDRLSRVYTLVLLVTDPCLTCWWCCSHPHAHHTLACPSTGKDELSRCWHWSDTRTRTPCSPNSPLLRAYTRFLLAFLSLSSLPLFSFQNVPPVHFISPGRLRGCSPPQAHPAPLAHGYHDDPCAPKRRASELVKEMLLRKYKGGLQSS